MYQSEFFFYSFSIQALHWPLWANNEFLINRYKSYFARSNMCLSITITSPYRQHDKVWFCTPKTQKEKAETHNKAKETNIYSINKCNFFIKKISINNEKHKYIIYYTKYLQYYKLWNKLTKFNHCFRFTYLEHRRKYFCFNFKLRSLDTISSRIILLFFFLLKILKSMYSPWNIILPIFFKMGKERGRKGRRKCILHIRNIILTRI